MRPAQYAVLSSPSRSMRSVIILILIIIPSFSSPAQYVALSMRGVIIPIPLNTRIIPIPLNTRYYRPHPSQYAALITPLSSHPAQYAVHLILISLNTRLLSLHLICAFFCIGSHSRRNILMLMVPLRRRLLFLQIS
ncbi:hypothetical protein B0H14DRAFT_3481541 [Mycena olivaceomarginata]|nr:hypothetical protein B0H14DRAFT_3481541 [Mycena olivaceomarginata]